MGIIIIGAIFYIIFLFLYGLINGIISTEKKSSSTEKESSSTEKESSSTEKESSSTEKKSSSTEKESSSTEKESSSTGKESSSTEKESSSTEKKTLKDTILFVSSNPGKAKVFLNGEYIGQTPLTFKTEPLENATVKVTKEGYEDYQEVITIKKEERTRIHAVLKKIAETVLNEEHIMEPSLSLQAKPAESTEAELIKPTVLFVNSNVEKAEVFLNDKYVGQTPLTFKTEPLKNATVKVTKEGYEDYQEAITIKKEERTTVEVELIKPTVLFVNSNAEKAEVFLNDEYVGQTPLTFKTEPLENATVKVTKEGYEDYQEVITVKSEEKAHIYMVLKKITETVLIKKGSFQIGDTSGKGRENEKPLHTVTITYDFYIGNHEITLQEYEDEGNVNEPMVDVSWYDAINYCNRLSKKSGLARAYSKVGNLLDKNGKKTSDPSEVEGYRLPTEAEWEYAIGKINKNEYIWEWCSDWYSENYYKNSPIINPYNSVQGAFRVKRGGSFDDVQDICPSRRSYDYPKRRRDNVGFRIVRTKTLNSPLEGRIKVQIPPG